ncbi:MAG: lamin tail domain-containing protein [Myxococcales bacterium]|nr:lamin tail domain-containing protein [Myxococcales bacterium]
MFLSRWLPITSLVLLSAGCELIASVDSSKIPKEDDGGGGGAGGSGGGEGGCSDASQCAAPENECQVAACVDATCGAQPKPAGTPATAVAGNCSAEQCDGSGAVQLVANDEDLPDDGMECTQDVCQSGTAAHPPEAAGFPCGRNDALQCDGAGICVGCIEAEDCGVDTECQTFACNAGRCETTNVAAGTELASQTEGDCQKLQCNGSGAVESVDDDADLPDDDNACTEDVCTSGTPSNPNVMQGTTCGTSLVCDGNGQCVGCLAPSECPGSDTECQTRTCNAGVCGFAFAAPGTVLAQQAEGDCKQDECDGSGGVTSVNLDTDVPPEDGDVCTTSACDMGNPMQAAVMDGTPCSDANACTQTDTCQAGFCTGSNPVVCTALDQCHVAGICDPQNGSCSNPNAPDGTGCDDGDDCTQTDTCQTGACSGANPVVCTPLDECHVAGVCDSGTGTCSNPTQPDGTPCTGGACLAGSCEGAPQVVSTLPAEGATNIAESATISITFNTAMSPASLTLKSTLDSGPCTGTIQVSTDDFVTCVPLTSPALSAGDTVLTVTPDPSLSFGATFKIRVTTGVQSAAAIPLQANFELPTGFTTRTDVAPINDSIVISQVYGGGGNTGAPYTNDFIELHNRGTTTVSLAGYSVQYASSAGTTWTATNLTGSIPPGGYYLVQEGSGGANGVPLPTPNATGTIAMSATNGKVALVNTTTLQTGACPVGAQIVDFVGFGTANCFEGAAAAPAPSATASVLRGRLGFVDTNVNSADFATTSPNPRNNLSAVRTFTLNETNVPTEADYCAIVSPVSITATTATSTGDIYCQVYEAGQTEAGGAAGTFTVEIGYGPAGSNPESETGWTWQAAPFNVQVGNNDEYFTALTAPAPGSYRYGCRVGIGNTFTYCDFGGAGSNPSLSYETPNQPVLTVNP